MTHTTETTNTENNNVNINEINMEEIIGYQEDEDPSISFALLENEQEEELESQITQHGFALNPVTKLMVVGGGMLIGVGILALIWNGMQGSQKYTVKTIENQREIIEEIEPQNAELAELKAELALGKQKEQIEKLKATQQSKRQTTVDKKVTPPPPQKVVQQPQPLPQPKVQPKPQKKVTPPPKLIAKTEPKIDPYILWQQLSVAGSYGGNVLNVNEENQRNVVPNRPRLVASRNVTNNHSQNITRTSPSSSTNKPVNIYSNLIASSPNSSSSTGKTNQIKINQVVDGKLATPLIWYSEDEEELPPAIITLSQAIVTEQGQEIFPSNSILIAEVKPYSKNGGLVELEVREVRLPSGKIQSIPQDTIVINRDNGKPLIAELQREGGDDGGGIDTNTILDGASIVGDFMDIPGTRSLHLLRRRGNNYRRNRDEITSYWYLPENINVSVRVIKPFSVQSESQPEVVEPMELDLEAIR